MSEIIDTAGDTGTDGAAVVVQSDQLQVPTPEARVAAAVAAMGGKPVEQQYMADKAEPQKLADVKPQPGQPSLAETIRAAREARENAQRATQAKSSLEAELQRVRSELAAVKAETSAFEDDPVGFAKARKWSKEQQLLYGQSLLYDLAPDKADPQFRIKMFEDKQRRREREQTEAQQAAAREAEGRAVQAQLEQFYTDTASAVQALPPGSYPAVEDWFGDDTESLMTSLMATARNLSAAATKNGQVADLKPAALMAAVEAEATRRMAAVEERKQRRAVPAKPAAVVPAQRAPGGVHPIETPSTKNMNGAGTAQPPATSDKERIARAIAAGFASR